MILPEQDTKAAFILQLLWITFSWHTTLLEVKKKWYSVISGIQIWLVIAAAEVVDIIANPQISGDIIFMFIKTNISSSIYFHVIVFGPFISLSHCKHPFSCLASLGPNGFLDFIYWLLPICHILLVSHSLVSQYPWFLCYEPKPKTLRTWTNSNCIRINMLGCGLRYTVQGKQRIFHVSTRFLDSNSFQVIRCCSSNYSLYYIFQDSWFQTFLTRTLHKKCILFCDQVFVYRLTHKAEKDV